MYAAIFAAAVLAKVNNERIHAGEKVHCRACGWPQISGLANMLNFKYPMFVGSRSAFSNPQLMRSSWRRIAASETDA